MPLTIRYLAKNGIYAEAGIQPGFLLSARDKYNGNNDNYRSQVNSFDFGIPIGLGYQFNNRFELGIRMIEGLSNINKASVEKDHNLVLALKGTYKLRK
ncbi:MAG: outer membrane beta-barrel protein [Bacteroidetes bacterium]|nr:outer membrane beta-barrel protein [Bacteroidota bacterium]